ncbi:helix-turn-helix domain-containing protein [Klebsiella variicola]|uniref:helix-turn-helix domain-containing protein n=1 Tax=Klebsiella variicola TaxID=244366 RepID=UPI001146AEF0|nr:LysR family transcriptional regulator [Klebsiella variicola]
MDELKVFLSVARLKSFTKAAAEIGVTPSAVSHTVNCEARSACLTLISLKLEASMKPLFPGLPVKMLALFLLVLVIPLKAAISKEKSHMFFRG